VAAAPVAVVVAAEPVWAAAAPVAAAVVVEPAWVAAAAVAVVVAAAVVEAVAVVGEGGDDERLHRS
jgi:hypothetical protein